MSRIAAEFRFPEMTGAQYDALMVDFEAAEAADPTLAAEVAVSDLAGRASESASELWMGDGVNSYRYNALARSGPPRRREPRGVRQATGGFVGTGGRRIRRC